ncbi:hypothetical protein [Acinetobacter soli]|uniref:Uncharacterized protein n=1 Tax=Acinetobacter soli TaxID=487316 RepID=A0AB38YT55_9GAMM|nr:hypothetical protein [Acinetobacter soli]WND04484.1 hypothetical protein RHP80_09600 [Acinetobacter soli]
MSNHQTCGKCIACKQYNGTNGNGYQPCHNSRVKRESKPVPPDAPRPPIQIIGESKSEKLKEIKELTLSKALLSALLISIPIILWKLDAIIFAIKS